MTHDNNHDYRDPDISCGCCDHDDNDKEAAGPFDKAAVRFADTFGRILPGRASAWYDKLEFEARCDLGCVVVATLLLILGVVLSHTSLPFPISLVVFILAYLVAGLDILAASVRHIRSGQIFDENLLMSVASLGAFALGDYPEAVAVMLFYRVGEFCEDWATQRSRSQIMDAVDMRPETVALLKDWQPSHGEQALSATTTIPAQDAQVGDYVLVRPGERIPLDSTVVLGESRLDTSPVTGEPVPVGVEPGSSVVSGCVNGQGMLVLQVDTPLEESMVTRILDSVEHAAANKPQMERFITRFARIYTPVVIGIAALTAIIPSLITGDWDKWLYTACTFLVISCPCAIVVSVPLSYFAGIGAASEKGILFKGGNVIEAANNLSAVVMDKTGTVTCGRFAVQEVLPQEPFSPDEVLQVAASAEAHSTHPIAQSIVQAASERGLTATTPAHVEELAGKGIRVRFALSASDASETLEVLCGNKALFQQEGVNIPAQAATLLDAADASTRVLVAIDGSFAGFIRIADDPRPDSAEAIARLRQHGLHTVMLTGDAEQAAQAVGEMVGIEEVRAHLMPQDKVDELSRVRDEYGAAMFVGDGINDAPVLAGADVGAAMGSGSDAAIEAADIVLLSSSLSSVPQSLDIAQTVQRIAKQNIIFALAVKLVIMIFGFAGLASMWLAVFADVGVALLCILNSVRILRMHF